MIKRKKWSKVKELIIKVSESTSIRKDKRLSIEFAHAAERVGLYELSTELSVINAKLLQRNKTTDWNGEDLSNKHLCITFKEGDKQGLAIGLHMAGYISEVSKKAAKTQLIVEKRLVPIFLRTLPNVKVLPYPEKCDSYTDQLVTSNMVNLWQNLGTSDKQIRSRFTPLKNDKIKSGEIREQYLSSSKIKRPLVGISWHSSHFGKDLPDIHHWLNFICSFDCIFVNIQYGNIKSDVLHFKNALQERFINDSSVNQLISMDDFCNQLGALDAVVTISNTGAHLSSAMGIPTIVLRDDWFRRAWPVLNSKTPWYPNTITIGKDGRQWADVFTDVQQTLQNMIIQP